MMTANVYPICLSFDLRLDFLTLLPLLLLTLDILRLHGHNTLHELIRP
jgi:hypothetical protein